MQYEEIIEIIQSKRRFGKAYGRDVTAEMMDLLGHPEEGMQIIHIAGTNGKGSVIAYLYTTLTYLSLSHSIIKSRIINIDQDTD